MRSVVALAIRHARPALVAWLAVVGLLGLVGLGVESKLHRSDLTVPGSPAAEAFEQLRADFGESFDSVVLLRGPRPEIDGQGRRLARSIQRIPGVSLISPWRGPGGEALRPRPGAALVIVRTAGSFEHLSEDVVPEIRAAAEKAIERPVQVHVSGYADIADGLHGGTVAAIAKAELIAMPLLLVILLLVFRSPITAALPLFIGLTTIAAMRGAIELTNQLYPLDALALNAASMMGLALGVDYALLMVSRYREELRSRGGRAAVLAAAQATGHTIASAGAALVVATAASMLVVPGGLFVGVGVALTVTVVLSVLAALTAMPAILTLLGGSIDRWAFGDVDRSSRVGTLALRALRRPGLAMALVLLLTLGLSTATLALETGPPDPRALPPGKQLDDYVAVERTLGGGWIAPYEISLSAATGTLTDEDGLAAIERFERRLAARPDVATVLGPGGIARRTEPLERLPSQLVRSRRALRDGLESQDQLADGLARAANGIAQLSGGLEDAAAGAGQLSTGGDAAAGAARRLQAGLAAADEGVGDLQAGLVEGRSSARRLAAGSHDAASGAERIERGLSAAHSSFGGGLPRIELLRDGLAEASGDLQGLRRSVRATRRGLERGLLALDQMQPATRAEPGYAVAHDAISDALTSLSGRDPRAEDGSAAKSDGVEALLSGSQQSMVAASGGISGLLSRSQRLADGLKRLRAGSRGLESGLRRLTDGTHRLAIGFDGLTAGGSELAGGLDRLARGGGELASGVERTAGGAGALARGLGGGASQVAPLREGIGEMQSGVLASRARSRRLDRQARGVGRLDTLLASGYFRLAALDGAPSPVRDAASFALNVDRGGGGARIAVVGYGDAQKAGHPLRGVLERELTTLEEATGAKGRLGGIATGLQDFDIATSDRLPLLALVLSLGTFVVLVIVLKSVVLPALAVVFNLLTVSAAFGVMVLCFHGSDPLLGGPGFVDAITAYGIFSIMFGLSIDYEVFLLARMREGYELTGSTMGAIRHGLERTAGVITGAALIMTAVFVSFATTDITIARQLGLALTVAVLLDATLIRLVLLPAAMRLCGEANWWLPAWLDRLGSGSRRNPPVTLS